MNIFLPAIAFHLARSVCDCMASVYCMRAGIVKTRRRINASK